MASGVDHIDTDELRKRGLLLGNTPKALDDAVADVAVGLMIAAARRFKEGVKELETLVYYYVILLIHTIPKNIPKNPWYL